MNLSNLHSKEKREETAFKYSNKLLKLSTKSNDKFHQAVALSYIGLIYSDKGDTGKALKYLKQALEIAKKYKFKSLEKKIKSSLDEIKNKISE